MVSVLEHEYEYSKTVVFNLEYTYPWGQGTQKFSRGTSIGSFKKNQCQRLYSYTCFPRLIYQKKCLCSEFFPTTLSKSSSYLKSYQMHLHGLENPLWHKGTTLERVTPESPMSAVSEPTTGWDSALLLNRENSGKSPYLISFRKKRYFHIYLSWKMKLNFSWASDLSDWFGNNYFQII